MILRSPRLQVTVLGTRFLMDVRDDSSRVEVLEGTVQVQAEERADSPVELKAGQQATASGGELRITPGAWPANALDPVFVFRPDATESRSDAQGLRIHAEGVGGSETILRPRRNARREQGRLKFDGGAYLVDQESVDFMFSYMDGSHQLTIEAVFQTADLNQTGPARWITFSTSSNSYNFTLAQEGRDCILRLLTTDAPKGKGSDVKLFEIPDDRPHHLAVTYTPGKLACYLDGEQVPLDDEIKGTLDNWTEQNLLFGNEWNGGREWRGQLGGIAIYDRALTHEKVRRNFLHYQLRYPWEP